MLQKSYRHQINLQKLTTDTNGNELNSKELIHKKLFTKKNTGAT